VLPLTLWLKVLARRIAQTCISVRDLSPSVDEGAHVHTVEGRDDARWLAHRDRRALRSNAWFVSFVVGAFRISFLVLFGVACQSDTIDTTARRGAARRRVAHTQGAIAIARSARAVRLHLQVRDKMANDASNLSSSI
jgi:hypothetical protein